MSNALLEVQNLRTYFHTDEGTVRAVDDVSLSIEEGSTLGVVGESGSGKSVTALSVMRLLAGAGRIEGGEISFLGRDLIRLPEPQMRTIRGKDISMIFQEPMTSLNPVFRVGDQVAEAIIIHQKVEPREARRLAVELFKEVGIDDAERRADSYPHQMSGGQKQRVMIAMALSCNPKLLIADEPTTALDVTIQAEILKIMRRLRDNRGMSILFITHDLGVIAEIADSVAVMFQGKLLEYGSVVEIFESPKHPYTKGLLACRPRLDSKYKRLPTVDDFMETRGEGTPQIEIIEKTLSEARIEELMTQGRGRLLHPKAELKQMGHPWEEGGHQPDATCVAENAKPLLSIENLKVHFPIRRGVFSQTVGYVKAVDGVSFNVYRGQTLGLVGESGCGKTTTGRALLRLTPMTEGKVEFDGVNINLLAGAELRRFRRRMQIIFQDPYGSLNPRMTIESILTEPMVIQNLGNSKRDRRDRAAELLREVDLEANHLSRYPHEFSGGQRQRIGIARALAVEPEFIVCDESVSALDVSVQAQVLNLLKDLQLNRGLTYIFISHDLSVVKFMSDMMAVMNDGQIVEFGPSETIYAHPSQEYTRKLIKATPSDELDAIRERQAARNAARDKRLAK